MWLFRNISTEEKNILFITLSALFFSISENNTMLWYSEEHSAMHKIYNLECFVQK